eukprot:9500541-Pyramimonas_sp.AAC.1
MRAPSMGSILPWAARGTGRADRPARSSWERTPVLLVARPPLAALGCRRARRGLGSGRSCVPAGGSQADGTPASVLRRDCPSRGGIFLN